MTGAGEVDMEIPILLWILCIALPLITGNIMEKKVFKCRIILVTAGTVPSVVGFLICTLLLAQG
jgi:hypothetical protein